MTSVEDGIFFGLVLLGKLASVLLLLLLTLVAVASVEDEGVLLGLVSSLSLVVAIDMGGDSSVDTMVPGGVVSVASVVDESVLLGLVAGILGLVVVEGGVAVVAVVTVRVAIAVSV